MEKQEVYEILNEAYFSNDCHEAAILDELVPVIKGQRLFVDVGASLGQFTLHANKCMEDGQIIAIEADPIRFEELERNCEKWQGERSNKIQALHGACSDSSEPKTFNTSDSNVSGGLECRQSDDVEWRKVTVPGLTLDDVVPDLRPALIKIDVEGAEFEVLDGAKKLVGDKQVSFFIEHHSWARHDTKYLRELMSDAGYEHRRIDGRFLFTPIDRSIGTRVRQKIKSILKSS